MDQRYAFEMISKPLQKPFQNRPHDLKPARLSVGVGERCALCEDSATILCALPNVLYLLQHVVPVTRRSHAFYSPGSTVNLHSSCSEEANCAQTISFLIFAIV